MILEASGLGGEDCTCFLDIARYTETYLIKISGAFMKSTLNSTSATSPFIWMAYIQVVTIAVYFQVKFQPWLIEYISSI